MAPLVNHVVVGERTFAQLRRLDKFDNKDYGPFLLGCVLVDVHGFSDVDRRETHFVGRLEEDGVDAFNKSCTNFLNQLSGDLWRRSHICGRSSLIACSLSHPHRSSPQAAECAYLRRTGRLAAVGAGV